MKGKSFSDHELVFLGTGGGRIHCVTQHRKTGGIIYSFNGDQAHLEPGPGAIVYLNEMKIDALKTKWIIITHNHTDHCNDAPVIIESVHGGRLSIPVGTLISTNDFISHLSEYYKNLLEEIIDMVAGKSINMTENTKITGTKTVHGDTPAFGLIFEQKDPDNSQIRYKLGFTSDTEIFSEYAEIYKGIDIMVANILRPNDRHCPRHTSVDEIIPLLNEIKPKVFVMTHFGAFMDSKFSEGDLVPGQVVKIQEAVGDSIKIIGAADGLRLNIVDLLK